MKPKILIADDEPDVVDLVATNLRAAGYDVSKAQDGPSVLAAVREQAPHLLVLDLMLPGMSGLEVCRALKADPTTAAIPIVMLTAKAEEVDRIVGLLTFVLQKILSAYACRRPNRAIRSCRRVCSIAA